jgi:hypothetical protein
MLNLLSLRTEKLSQRWMRVPQVVKEVHLDPASYATMPDES